MTFLNLFGLLGLISILLLIIIYILKPKYQEQMISSSLIWKLSLKYKKKKIPFEWIKSSLLLILQILILLMMTAILMKPNIVLQSETGEKIVILDISASMLADQRGNTRLENAISDIESLARRTINNNDKFTLITAGQESNILIYRTESFEYVKNTLSQIQSDYAISNIDDAMLLTEDIVEINPSVEILYYTNEEYNDPGTVDIINMSNNEWNVAILDFKGEMDLSLNYVFEIDLVSYGEDVSNLLLELKTDGFHEDSMTVDLKDGIVSHITWKIDDFDEHDFDVASLELLEIEDDFSYDNTLMYYSNESKFRIQIVSTDTTEHVDSTREYLTSSLRALEKGLDITFVNDLEEAESTGFDLYIYSETVPESLPEDGAIWIFDPNELPIDLGVNIVDVITVDNVSLMGNDTSSDIYQTLMRQVTPGNITVSKYQELDYDPSYSVILSYDSDPMLLTKNIDGVKVSIFAFGLAYSNLPILFIDFPVLVRNLSDYSLVKTFDKDIYNAGETVEINTNPMTETVLISHDGESETFDQFPFEYELNEVGTYEVIQQLSDGRTITKSFYVRISRNESDFSFVGDVIETPQVSQDQSTFNLRDELYSLLPYLAAFLLVLVLVEWEVQYREQY